MEIRAGVVPGVGALSPQGLNPPGLKQARRSCLYPVCPLAIALIISSLLEPGWFTLKHKVPCPEVRPGSTKDSSTHQLFKPLQCGVAKCHLMACTKHWHSCPSQRVTLACLHIDGDNLHLSDWLFLGGIQAWTHEEVKEALWVARPGATAAIGTLLPQGGGLGVSSLTLCRLPPGSSLPAFSSHLPPSFPHGVTQSLFQFMKPPLHQGDVSDVKQSCLTLLFAFDSFLTSLFSTRAPIPSPCLLPPPGLAPPRMHSTAWQLMLSPFFILMLRIYYFFWTCSFSGHCIYLSVAFRSLPPT